MSFLFSWCSTGGPEAHSAGWWLPLLHFISIFSGPQFNQGSRGPLRPGVALPTTSHLSPSPTLLRLAVELQLSWLLSWLSYIIVQRPLDRPLDLWNRMFNHHQAEITVMQFRGHSLPVRQSMKVSWEFFTSSHFISQFPPTRFPLITAIEWHFGSGRKSKYNTWTAVHRLSVIWKSDLSDKIKRDFFQTVVMSILLYGYTTWMLTKHMEKKLDGNCTRKLWAILYKCWKQHPTQQQLYGYLPSILKTIQIRRTRHVGHCWRSKDKWCFPMDPFTWTCKCRMTS